MATEIERKFLVTDTTWRQEHPAPISQGYLSRDPKRTVRVRRDGERAFLTVKGITCGATRSEFEYAIPTADADAMLALCEGPIICKLRHTVWHQGFKWEVDEFQAENAGLVVAEIELHSENQAFVLPPWLGEEVTHDARYYNSNLTNSPYRTWIPK